MGRPLNCGRCNKPKRPRGKNFKELPGYCECGRPGMIDKLLLSKLEDAFSISCSDEEACTYAGISPTTLYRYQEKNPEFRERKAALKLKPNIVAKRTVVSSLAIDQNSAWKWVEKKDPEMKPTSKVEHAGSIDINDPTNEMSKEESEALELFRTARRKRIESTSDKMN